MYVDMGIDMEVYYKQMDVVRLLDTLLNNGKLVYLNDTNHFYNANAILGGPGQLPHYVLASLYTNSTGIETRMATGPHNIVPVIQNLNWTNGNN